MTPKSIKIITKLTKAQKRAIPRFIDKYIGLAQKPTNRKKAAMAVQNLYASIGEKKPIVVFGQSPFATIMMAAMSKTTIKGDSQLRSQLNSQLRSQLYSQLDSQLYSQLSSQLDSQLYSQLSSQLDSQLYSQLDSQLYSQLRSQLDSQLSSQLSSQRSDWWLVVWWLVWAGFYMFGEYIGVKFDSKILKTFIDFVTNVNFIIPYKGIAFVSETPKIISWKNGLLHNETGGAVEYSDGYSLYAINGVRVTEKIVKTPEKLTKRDWEKEKNLEVRRIIQERMGDKFVKALKAKSIQKDKYGELLEVELKNDPEKTARYVKLKDSSTNRIYYLRVRPDVKTAKEAVSWSFDINEEEYNPKQET